MTRTFVVSGRVQGVGFRYFVRQHASRLGIAGWVRNLDNGQVEVLALGDPPQLEELERLLARGPRFAAVQRVDVREISDALEPLIGFEVIG